jgi:hypothetical protein
MSDDQTPNTEPVTPTPAVATPAAQPVPPDIQALIDAAASAAHNAAWKQARETFAKKTASPGGNTPPAATPAPAPATDVSAEYARLRAFDRTLAKFDLSEKAAELTERDFAAAKPPDPVAWLNERAEGYGWKRHGQPAPAPTGQPVTPPPAVPNGPPVTSRGTPPNAATVTDDVPILSMSIPDRMALIAKIGEVAYAERHRRELKTRNVMVRTHLV